MKLDFGKTSVKINVSFAAVVTLMLILDESGLCALGLLCCVIHEFGHIICLLIMGEHPKLIELSFYGIKLERRQMSSMKNFGEIIVYASGPAANMMFSATLFLLSGAAQGMQTAAIISLGVGLFNLIPCRPLDGGNIIYSLICRHTDERQATAICRAVSLALIIPMGVVGFAVLIKNGNFTLIGVTVYLTAAVFFASH